MDNNNNTFWVCAAVAPMVNKSNLKDWESALIAFDISTRL